MKLLVCNAGSTSLKFKLWEMPEQNVLAEGRIERVGSDRAIFRYIKDGTEHREEPVSIPDYTFGINKFLDMLAHGERRAVDSLDEIAAVGFKTVLSKGFLGVHELTEDVLDGMRAYMSVAPSHNRPYLDAIDVFTKLLPNARRVGVFETAFHKTIPEARRVYSIPYEWYEKYGIMRMGYHGASHGYIAKRLKNYKRVISCHLGGSASICAILDGKSMDNSFGFSLQAGIPHSTRTGDVDVYVIPYLLSEGLTMDEIMLGLGKNGGLKGISGTSGDMRDITEAIEQGSERARLALDALCTAILRYIGAYTMELGGVDALAFTGGIGENSSLLRKMVLDAMRFMGVQLDETANNEGKGDRRISAEGSKVDVFVISANEELVVAYETYNYCTKNNYF